MNFYIFKEKSFLPEDIITEIGKKYFTAENTINFGLLELLEFSKYITELVPLSSDIRGLPMMNELLVLTIGSRYLYSIPALPKLVVLNIYHNLNLKNIPYLSQLQVLQLSDNQHIQTLPSFDKLLLLTLDRNQKIQELPYLPSLKFLKMGDNQLPNLPPMSNLQVLILSRNNTLKELPVELPLLKWLDTGYNDQLTTLPPLPNLRVLILRRTISLQFLPDNLSQLIYLHLGINDNIISLPERLPRLEYLDLDNTAVMSLPPLPSLRTFYHGINNHLRTTLRHTMVSVEKYSPHVIDYKYIKSDYMYQYPNWYVELE